MMFDRSRWSIMYERSSRGVDGGLCMRGAVEEYVEDDV
jgi:hypothetical protein